MAVSKYSESLGASDNDNRGTFHISGGQNVELSEGNTMAQIGGEWRFFGPSSPSCVRSDSVHTQVYVRRLVFTSKPIEVAETFQVHVTRRKHMKSSGLGHKKDIIFVPPAGNVLFSDRLIHTDVQQNLAIGFIAYDPARLLAIPEDGGIAEGWHYSPDVWMLSEDRVYHDGRKEAKHNLCVYQPDSNTIGCRVNEKGCLEFIMDGKNHGVVWSKPLPMDRPLWGFVDLPIEYKIQACFTYGQGPPPPYEPSVEQNPDPQSDTNQILEQKITDLEATLQKNAQEVHRMQQELASNFQKQLMDIQTKLNAIIDAQKNSQEVHHVQKQLDVLMDMQRQFQTQFSHLASDVENLKL